MHLHEALCLCWCLCALQYNSDAVRELWQYEPWLSARSLRRGVFSLGDTARMRRFTHKLLSGEAVCLHLTTGAAASPLPPHTAAALAAVVQVAHASTRLLLTCLCPPAPAPAGQPVSVTAVGGSVTAGQGALHGGPFMTRLWDFIRKVSPQAKHTLKHGAFGGSVSGLLRRFAGSKLQCPAMDVAILWTSFNRISVPPLLQPSLLCV